MIDYLKNLLKQDKIRNFLYFSSASFISAFIGVITLKVFTNYMPPEEFGLWTFALTFNSFAAAFIVLDLHSYFLIEASKDTFDKKKLLSSLLSFSFVWSVISCCLLIGIGFLSFHYAFEKIDFFPYIFYILLSNLVMGFGQFLLIVYRVENKPLSYFLYSIFQSTLAIFTSLGIVIYLLHNAHGRVIGYSAGMLLSGFVAVVILWKSHGYRFRIDGEMMRKALRFSAPLIPYAIATLSIDFLDRVFVEEYCSMNELGLFGLASQLNTIIYFIFISLVRVYEPSVIRWVNNQEYPQQINFFLKYNLLLVIATLGLMLVSGFLVFQLTNARYAGSAIMVIDLSPFYYLKTLALLLLTMLISGYKTFKALYISLIMLALYAVIGFWVIPQHGMHGMILVKTLVMAAGCIVSFLFLGNARHYLRLIVWLVISTIVVTALTVVIHRFNFYL